MKELWNKIKETLTNANKTKVFIQGLVAFGITVLTYNSLNPQDITTWNGLWNLVVGVFSNPYLIGYSVYNVYTSISNTKKANITE